MNALREISNEGGYQRMITIRIRATGQVTEMVPDVARAMILGGTAEEFARPETMARAGAETALAAAQNAARKSINRRAR
jgi:hypothetical protein